MTGQPGPKQQPVMGVGPVAELANRLRQAGTDAGSLSVRRIAGVAKCSPATVSRAVSGAKLPTWDAVESILTGCGISDSVALGAWRDIYDDLATQARQFSPDLASCASVEALTDELSTLMKRRGLSIEQVADTISRPPGGRTPGKMPADKPDRSQLEDVFLHRRQVLTKSILMWTVFGSGGVEDDVDHWIRHLERVSRAHRGTASNTPEPGAAAHDNAGPVAVTETRWVQAPAARRRRLLTIGSAVLAVVTIVVLTVAVWMQPSGRMTAAGPDAAPDVDAAPQGSDLQRFVDPLARRLRAEVDPAGNGPYICVHRRTLSYDTTNPDQLEEAVEDDRLCRDERDGSGHQVTTRTPPGGSPREDPPYAYPPGGVILPLEQEPSTDPDALRQQLDGVQPSRLLGPVRFLRAIAEINNYYVLTGAQRAAVLEVLVSVEGITLRGPAIDRAERPGVAVSADDATGRYRDTLIFDATSGRLLAHEKTDMPNRSIVATTTGHAMYLDARRTDRVN